MANLEVRAAVDIAKREVRGLFDVEGIENVGLEEVVHDPDAGRWRVTIGFKRPWAFRPPRHSPYDTSEHPRTYKLVTIDDESRQVIGLAERATPRMFR